MKELERALKEREIGKKHLSALEFSFSDLLEKYNRSKQIIHSYSVNEYALKSRIKSLESTLAYTNDKYGKLKEHVKQQLQM